MTFQISRPLSPIFEVSSPCLWPAVPACFRLIRMGEGLRFACRHGQPVHEMFPEGSAQRGEVMDQRDPAAPARGAA